MEQNLEQFLQYSLFSLVVVDFVIDAIKDGDDYTLFNNARNSYWATSNNLQAEILLLAAMC